MFLLRNVTSILLTGFLANITLNPSALYFQTHYLIYGKGFQTWEYSPAYAIRSYAYLLLHAWPAAFHARILQTNKVRAGQPGNNHNWLRVGWVSGTVLWKRQNRLVVLRGDLFWRRIIYSFIMQLILMEQLLFGRYFVKCCGCNNDQIPALMEFLVQWGGQTWTSYKCCGS